MKKLLAVIFLCSISSVAMADKFSSSINDPFITSTRLVDKCIDGNENSCMSSSSTSSTLFTTSSTFARYKEEIRQVEPDAYQFLAGEDKTLALDNVINLLREDSSEFDSLSDLEITAIMVEGLSS